MTGDLSGAWVTRDAPERLFKRIAREIGALPVVAIFENAPTRWPREQDRGNVRAGIMDDLSHSIYRVVEMIVEAMNIDENPAGYALGSVSSRPAPAVLR
jgi:hypothetical protein